MGFFNFIKQNHRKRISADFFRKLAPILVAHIARRGSDHLGHTVLLHIFRHIYPDHGFLVAKHSLCQCFGNFRLSDTGWSQKQERTDRTLRVFESHATTADSLGNCRYCFFLSNHALVQCFFQFLQTGCLAFCQTADRNLCPSSHHIGNLIFAHHRNFVFGYAAVLFFKFFPGCLQALPCLFPCAGFLDISLLQRMLHIQFRLMDLAV